MGHLESLLRIDTVAHGLAHIERGAVKQLPASTRARIRAANHANDAGELDAYAADVIVQAALFGDVIYASC